MSGHDIENGWVTTSGVDLDDQAMRQEAEADYQEAMKWFRQDSAEWSYRMAMLIFLAVAVMVYLKEKGDFIGSLFVWLSFIVASFSMLRGLPDVPKKPS